MSSFATRRLPSRVADEGQFKKLQDAVRLETQNRISKWVDQWLSEYQKKKPAVWPDLEELKREAKSLPSAGSIDDDAASDFFAKEVDRLTHEIQNPFAELNFAHITDGEKKSTIETLVKMYQWLLEMQSATEATKRDLIETRLLLGIREVEEIPVGSEFLVLATTKEQGTLTQLSFGSEGDLVLFSPKTRMADQQSKLRSRMSKPGADLVVSILTDVPPMGEPLKGTMYMVAPTDISLVERAFKRISIYRRVLEHLKSGKAYPFKSPPEPKVKWWSRKTLELKGVPKPPEEKK